MLPHGLSDSLHLLAYPLFSLSCLPSVTDYLLIYDSYYFWLLLFFIHLTPYPTFSPWIKFRSSGFPCLIVVSLYHCLFLLSTLFLFIIDRLVWPVIGDTTSFSWIPLSFYFFLVLVSFNCSFPFFVVTYLVSSPFLPADLSGLISSFYPHCLLWGWLSGCFPLPR